MMATDLITYQVALVCVILLTVSREIVYTTTTTTVL